ncbi:MAG: hypothetical protein AAF403_01820 [Pseudomonadota bacterium]
MGAFTVGGPISTMIIIAELTNDTNLTLAVMAANVTASRFISRYWFQSYFAMVIYKTRHGLIISGEHDYDMLHTTRAQQLMHPQLPKKMIEARDCWIKYDDNLEDALAKFERCKASELPVLNSEDQPIGHLTYHETSQHYRRLVSLKKAQKS